MRYMTAKEIRETWLKFFESKHHQIAPSASLIPNNDPTLLWINAGVAPLKKYFDGREKPLNPRITNIQKCIRTNDIENVGLTARHHTFFEMMGNFSIGDYFKKEAIAFAYELLTSDAYFAFPIEKLYMTYYPTDLEAKQVWLSLGIKEDHLIPREDNFWEIGEGPCGPDTEIYFDRGSEYDQRGKELVEEDIENERYIEIWNIVFSQYNAKANTKREDYLELPSKNIDTGAGLERFCCVIQGTKTNFETDLFLPIITKIEQLSHIPYQGQTEFKVIADHIKTLTFSISDGAMLSNEGRGYVLRRLLRRAVKHGRKLGFKEPFLHILIDSVIATMGDFYPNIIDTKDIVKQICFKEESKFLETIEEGERHLKNAISNSKSLDGETLFKLYDTYGFPLELSLEYAQELNLSVDVEGFKSHLQAQKERSRQSRQQMHSMQQQDEAYLNFHDSSVFIGYDMLKSTSKVIAVFNDGIVLDQTPFYAESGGQVSDQGTINGSQVITVSKLPNGQTIHQVEGQYEVGDDVLAIVDAKTRLHTMQNHTATHLVHQALKDVLGKHANQQGSRVDANETRFDFNHYENITDEQILTIEKIVNDYIKKQVDVVIKQMSLDEAKKLGAMALFGEKYGKVVRVVDIDWSKELCGGTHVKNTKDIVKLAVTQVESIGSGIYRITGITGDHIQNKMKVHLSSFYQEINLLNDKAQRLSMKNTLTLPQIKGSYQDVIALRKYVVDLKNEIKNYEKQLESNEEQIILKQVDTFIINKTSKKQVMTLSLPTKVLKQVADQIYDKIKMEVLFIVNDYEGKLTFLCKTDGQTHAGDLVKMAAKMTNGSGGGKADMAQGGSQDYQNLDAMIEMIKGQL